MGTMRTASWLVTAILAGTSAVRAQEEAPPAPGVVSENPLVLEPAAGDPPAVEPAAEETAAAEEAAASVPVAKDGGLRVTPRLAFWYPRLDVEVKGDDGGLQGRKISLTHDTDLEDHDEAGEFALELEHPDLWGPIEVSYWQFNADGVGLLPSAKTFEGLSFPAGTRVSSTLFYQQTEILTGYTLFRGGPKHEYVDPYLKELRVDAGLHFSHYEAVLDAGAAKAEIEQWFSTPVVGGRFQIGLHENAARQCAVAIYGQARGMSHEFGTRTAVTGQGELGLRFDWAPRIAAGVGVRIYDVRNQLNTKGDEEHDIEMSAKGVIAWLGVTF